MTCNKLLIVILIGWVFPIPLMKENQNSNILRLFTIQTLALLAGSLHSTPQATGQEAISVSRRCIHPAMAQHRCSPNLQCIHQATVQELFQASHQCILPAMVQET